MDPGVNSPSRGLTSLEPSPEPSWPNVAPGLSTDGACARFVLERELATAGRHVAIVRRLDANGLDAWAQVVAHGWEGLVAKNEASPTCRVPGRGAGSR